MESLKGSPFDPVVQKNQADQISKRGKRAPLERIKLSRGGL
jgi:hypothetical protein